MCVCYLSEYVRSGGGGIEHSLCTKGRIIA